MWACETGNLEVAKLLLSKGASPYTTDSKQNTPLHRISMITAQTMPSAITVDVARLLFAAVKHAETDPDDSTPNNDAHRPSSAKPGAALDRALANASTKSLLPLTGSNSSLAKTPVPMVNVVGVPGLNKTVPSPVINISEESSAHSGRTRSRSGATPEHVSNLRNLVSTTSAPALPSENYKSRRPSSLSKTAESSLKVQLNVTVEGTSQEELDATRNVSSLKQISSHGKTNVGILPPLLAPLNILERPSSGRIGMAPVSPMLGGRRNFAAPSKVCSDYINLKNESQMTAVLSCALNGNRPLLEVLVENGGDYNEVTPSGHNAIMLAKTNRHAGTVAYLESLIPPKNDF